MPSASKINLLDAAVTKVTVTGDHGVDFNNSILTRLVTLDASGVTGTGAAGAVSLTFTSSDHSLFVSTGNGNDVLKLGAYRDTVYSSLGSDTITFGAGNDLYVLQSAAHSTASTFDTITDFVANTKASGSTAAAIANGATTTVADLTGDTISLKVGSLATAGIVVSVVNNATAAQDFLNSTAAANASAKTTGIALDSTSGKLYIDLDANGSIDSVITLTGVSTLNEAAFVVTH